MAVLQTLVSARDLGRLEQIAAVFIRHGLGDLVRRLGWADRLARAGHALRMDTPPTWRGWSRRCRCAWRWRSWGPPS